MEIASASIAVLVDRRTLVVTKFGEFTISQTPDRELGCTPWLFRYSEFIFKLHTNSLGYLLSQRERLVFVAEVTLINK